MKVRAIDVQTRRSDRRNSKPEGITKGKVYEVVRDYEVEKTDGKVVPKYRILNDDDKLSNHSQYRFEVVDNSRIEPLLKTFNALTSHIRVERRELREENAQLKKDVENKDQVMKSTLNYLLFIYGDNLLEEHPQYDLIKMIVENFDIDDDELKEEIRNIEKNKEILHDIS